MGPVVTELAKLPSTDIRAMAVYLASLSEGVTAEARVVATTTQPDANGRRVFEGACKACHAEGDGPVLFGVSPSLATNTNVHSERPDNLIKVILQGIGTPATPDLGYMPGFKDSLSNTQVAELAAYLRDRFAPDAPQWKGLEQTVAHLRANPGTH
ncbi:MAG: Nicotinate dehydrogenase subunit B [Pseudomonas fluorescens]|nr:MAG: Nicotinate dehydrogenase subunit B [Pseudomonas fluorescens]